MIRALSLEEAALYNGQGLQRQKRGPRACRQFGRVAQLPYLTPRQLQVAELMVKGWKNRQIAAELGISSGTVKQYQCHMYMRVGVKGLPGFFHWWYTFYLKQKTEGTIQ